MDRNRKAAGEATRCLCPSIRRGHESARDRRSPWHERRDRQETSVSRVADGPRRIKEVAVMHLSSEQVFEWALGERSAEVGRHLEDCCECREELARLQDGLSAFRQSAHDWADGPVRVAGPTPSAAAPVSWAWAGVTAMVIGLALFP